MDRHVLQSTKDEVLAQLVVQAGADEEAVLTLLALISPALRRIARGFGAPLNEAEVWAELVAGMEESIRRPAAAPRDRAVALASNLAMSALAPPAVGRDTSRQHRLRSGFAGSGLRRARGP